VQILTFTEHFVFRVAFVANNYEFDEDEHLDSSNYHYLVSLYTGSMTVVVIHKYIRDVQVRHTTTPRHNRFTALLSGTTRLSRCPKRTSGLYGAAED